MTSFLQQPRATCLVLHRPLSRAAAKRNSSELVR